VAESGLSRRLIALVFWSGNATAEWYSTCNLPGLARSSPEMMAAIDEELECTSEEPPSLEEVVGNIEPTAEEATVLRDLETMALKDLLHISACPSLLMRMSATVCIAGLCSSESGRRGICEVQPDAFPRLVGLIEDEHEGLRAHGFSALANLCENEEAAVRLAERGVGLKTMAAILDVVKRRSRMPEGCPKLLVNMTRIDLGRKAVLKGEEGSSAGAFAEHLSDLIDAFEASREKPGDPLAWLALFFENMAQEKEVANLLCNLHSGKHGFLLLRIAKGLAGSNHDRRLGAAGAVKNCCFYPEMHEHIVKHDEMSALMVLPLVGPPDGYDDEDKDQMYPVSVSPPQVRRCRRHPAERRRREMRGGRERERGRKEGRGGERGGGGGWWMGRPRLHSGSSTC
jgi:hypothetical protein